MNFSVILTNFWPPDPYNPESLKFTFACDGTNEFFKLIVVCFFYFADGEKLKMVGDIDVDARTRGSTADRL